MTNEPVRADKLNVFISYSRDDLSFADQLDATLRIGGFSTTLDRHGIDAGEDWRSRLESLIRDADTVVFVLTPASARSDVCAWEVKEAVHLGKRIIPAVPVPSAISKRRPVSPRSTTSTSTLSRRNLAPASVPASPIWSQRSTPISIGSGWVNVKRFFARSKGSVELPRRAGA